jgi:hypothetical protein
LTNKPITIQDHSLSKDWLYRRFEFDMKSRNRQLESTLMERLNAQPRPLTILDLGTGTGANFVYLSQKIEGPQHWVLLEKDPRFTSSLTSSLRTFGEYLPKKAFERWRDRLQLNEITYEIKRGDFTEEVEAFHQHQFDLITANAVFDLNSADQFSQLVRRIKASQPAAAQLYFTIHLDQGLQFFPPDAHDSRVKQYFHGHMQRAQNFGQAMGADAAHIMRQIFKSHGYSCLVGDSSWQVSPQESEFLLDNLNFIEKSLTDISDTEFFSEFQQWYKRRQTQLAQQSLSMTIANCDLLATQA